MASLLPSLDAGVELINRHLSTRNSTNDAPDEFPCFVHAQLVATIANWHRVILANPSATASRATSSKMKDVNALLQMATHLTPYACTHTSTTKSDVLRTLGLMLICIRTIFQWTPLTEEMPDVPWMNGILYQQSPQDTASALLTQVDTHTDPECIDRLALLYFSWAKHELMYALLDSQTPLLFVADQTTEEWNHVDDPSATALVEAANADFGVQVFRELISTFRAPRDSLPPRRTIFYHKEIRRVLERDHFDIMSEAHHIATQTPLKVWTQGVVPLELMNEESEEQANKKNKTFLDSEQQIEDEKRRRREQTLFDTDSTLERICAILAGMFVNLVDDVDRARTDDAFFGYVELPCFQTMPTHQDPQKMKLFGFNGKWFAYNVMNGKLTVHVKGIGLKGLCACAAKVIATHHMKLNS